MDPAGKDYHNINKTGWTMLEVWMMSDTPKGPVVSQDEEKDDH
jgi:hypothetical protein